jgi:hypothetical protein
VSSRGSLVKTELIHGARFDTEVMLRRELRRYNDYYNHRRRYSALGYRSPVTTKLARHKTVICRTPCLENRGKIPGAAGGIDMRGKLDTSGWPVTGAPGRELDSIAATASESTKTRLTRLYLIANRYEWQFWDMYWTGEQ